MGSKPSIVCDCRNPENAYKGLFGAGESLRGQIEWVHSCGRPTREYFESNIKLCSGCLRHFSNPWEDVCKRCHTAMVEGGEREPRTYRGWRWAARQGRGYEALMGQQTD